jgi:hypothetical protein
MMVCIHAAVGAAVGAVLRRPGAAFCGGVLSHLICDLIPHKDYDIKIEAPLAATVFAYLAKRYGVDSPQFLGAAGAVAPDAENALVVLGLLPRDKMVFPSHNDKAPWYLGHGKKVDSPLPQIILAAAALAVAEKVGPRDTPDRA